MGLKYCKCLLKNIAGQLYEELYFLLYFIYLYFSLLDENVLRTKPTKSTEYSQTKATNLFYLIFLSWSVLFNDWCCFVSCETVLLLNGYC